MHFHNFPDAVYMSIHFPCFFVSLSLPLSLHRPLQEFSQRLKASHWPSSPETVSASKLSGKPHHVTALAVGIFFYHLHSKCRISRLSPTRGSEAST